MKICGIDPSMNSSGKCIMELDDNTYDVLSVKFHGYCDTNKWCITGTNFEVFRVGTKYTKMNMFDRQNIAYDIILKDMEDIKFIAFEGYAFDVQQSNKIFQLGEFIGGIKKLFYDRNKGIIIYPPKVVKRFATGNGNADKCMMRKMFQEEFPQWYPEEFNTFIQDESPHSDLCDAFWIAETLRNHIKYENLGIKSLDEGTVALLEWKADKKSHSIIETLMVKKCETSPQSIT